MCAIHAVFDVSSQAYGVQDGVAAPATGVDLSKVGTSPSSAPTATFWSRTISVRNTDVNNTIRIDALRVNGAAVKPRCKYTRGRLEGGGGACLVAGKV